MVLNTRVWLRPAGDFSRHCVQGIWQYARKVQKAPTEIPRHDWHVISITYLKVRDFRLRAFLCVWLFVLNFVQQKGK